MLAWSVTAFTTYVRLSAIALSLLLLPFAPIFLAVWAVVAVTKQQIDEGNYFFQED